jgi:DNA-binding transcriptional regulator YiaG
MNSAKKIKVNVFDDLRESLQDAIAFECGKKIDLRVVELPEPPQKLRGIEIRKIRWSLKAAQVVFATHLNVSPNTVRSWEQGTRRPQGADPKLLSIVRKNPKAILEA